MSDQTLDVGPEMGPGMGTGMGAAPAGSAATGRLHRPVRAVVAAIELVLAVLAVVAAFPTWSAGIETITSRASDGTELTSTHYSGNWILAAIALGAVAAVLVIDAIRQLLLALRARGRRSRSAAPAHGGPSGA